MDIVVSRIEQKDINPILDAIVKACCRVGVASGEQPVTGPQIIEWIAQLGHYNLNDKILVTLTEYGEDKWAQYWDHPAYQTMRPKGERGVPPAIRAAATQKDGRVEFTTWETMHIFGGELCNGGPIPFVDNKIEYRR